MKSRNNKISVVLVVLSLIYVIYLTYISNNNLLVGATVSKGKNGDIVITNVDEFSMASYSGIEKGDIVKRINNKKINTNEIKMNKLKNVSSMIVERNGHNLELKMTLFNDKNFTTYLIPLIFYIVCLFCCFFILKINESKNLLSAVVLIIFLLSASIAFISAGGSAKGDMLSRLIMVVTLI
ncbi:PDZ domain-containing protein, partial [Bacillus subtilis]